MIVAVVEALGIVLLCGWTNLCAMSHDSANASLNLVAAFRVHILHCKEKRLDSQAFVNHGWISENATTTGGQVRVCVRQTEEEERKTCLTYTG